MRPVGAVDRRLWSGNGRRVVRRRGAGALKGRQVRTHPLKGLGTDPAHPAKVFRMAERPPRLPVGDDPLGQLWADSRQQGQFRPGGLVDIDLERGWLRRRLFDVDQAAAQAPLRQAPQGDRHEGTGQKPTGGCLLGTSH